MMDIAVSSTVTLQDIRVFLLNIIKNNVMTAETSSHPGWHWWSRACTLRAIANRSTLRKPTFQTWWPPHMLRNRIKSIYRHWIEHVLFYVHGFASNKFTFKSPQIVGRCVLLKMCAVFCGFFMLLCFSLLFLKYNLFSPACVN